MLTLSNTFEDIEPYLVSYQLGYHVQYVDAKPHPFKDYFEPGGRQVIIQLYHLDNTSSLFHLIPSYPKSVMQVYRLPQEFPERSQTLQYLNLAVHLCATTFPIVLAPIKFHSALTTPLIRPLAPYRNIDERVCPAIHDILNVIKKARYPEVVEFLCEDVQVKIERRIAKLQNFIVEFPPDNVYLESLSNYNDHTPYNEVREQLKTQYMAINEIERIEFILKYRYLPKYHDSRHQG